LGKNKKVDNRNKNLCELAKRVESKTDPTTLKDALKDKTLSIGFMTYMLSNETKSDDYFIDEENPHIGIQVMDELAKRAGFKYTFGVIDRPESTTRTKSNYRDWNELLLNETQY
jgi:hypothetical protein